MERVLRKDKHLNDNIQNEIQIKLFKPIKSTKIYTGILEKFDSAYITIVHNNEEIKIDRKNISQIKTVYNW